MNQIRPASFVRTGRTDGPNESDSNGRHLYFYLRLLILRTVNMHIRRRIYRPCLLLFWLVLRNSDPRWKRAMIGKPFSTVVACLGRCSFLLLVAARCSLLLSSHLFHEPFLPAKDGGFCPPNFREGCTWNSREKVSEKAFYFLFLVFHDRYFFIFLKRCILFTIILDIFSANATETVPNYTVWFCPNNESVKFLRCFWIFDYLCS